MIESHFVSIVLSLYFIQRYIRLIKEENYGGNRVYQVQGIIKAV